MLVEINLLPQKEPKKIGFIISISSIVALLIIAGSYYLWQINSVKSEVASLDSQISMTKKIAEKEQQNSQTVESTNSVSQLKSAIDWADEYPIQTVPVMRHLSSLLPERGFIQSFAYTEAGTINITVQFDSAREAAYFLENLTESKWIEDASLSSLTAAATADTAATGTPAASTTSQTNTTGTTSNATNQSSSTTTSQNSTGQAVTGSTSTAGNQTNIATGTTAAQNSTGTAANNIVSIVTNILSGQKSGTNILPRYTGQFEVKLNKAVVKENIKKSKNDEKGAAGS